MQILYVENDKLLSKSVELMLHQEGHFCHATTRGAEAVTLAKRNQYDIIVLEVMLPDVNGFEVIDRLCAEGIHTPVLFQTSLANHKNLDSGRPVALEEVLIKPFDKEVFLERIDAALARAGTSGGAAPIEPPVEPQIEPPTCEPQGSNRRQHKRVKTIKTAEIIHEHGTADCVILNMSDGGAGLRLPHNFLDCPTTFTLRLESGRCRQCRMCWRDHDHIGVEYIADE